MLPNEDEVAAELRVRFREAFVDLERVVQTVVSIYGQGGLTVHALQEIDRRTVDVILVLMSKACRTARVIQLVSERGLGHDALVLVRCLFEDWLCVNWLFASDWVVRANMIAAHDAQRKLVQVKAVLRDPDLAGRLSDGALDLVETNVRYWEERLGKDTVDSVKKHWSGRLGGVEGTARALGQLRLYDTLYRETSAHAHGSDIVGNIILDEEIGPTPRLAPDDFALPLTAGSAARLLWSLASTVDSNLGLGFTDRLATAEPRPFSPSEIHNAGKVTPERTGL